MDTVALHLSAAVVAGVLAGWVRLPPLVGFLVAGFALNATGVEPLSFLDEIAELGVTLLLFSIGLKLDVRLLVRREVWLTMVAHMAVSILITVALLLGLGTLGLVLLAGEALSTLVLLAFALSFSSTVLVVKVLEDRSETRSLYGRIAIGILVLQDIAAVAFMAVASDSRPTWWALLLVLVLPAAVPLRWLWSRLPHGEMQALFGISVALVPGFALFDALGIKGELGALVTGVLLAGHPAASELSRALLSVKDLLLVAFFLQIGFTGTLSWGAVGVGLCLLLLLPVQGWLYALMLRGARLRRRTAVLTGLSLTNHSEFALIVAALGISEGLLDREWLGVLSVAVAAGFLVSSLANGRTTRLLPVLTQSLPAIPADRLLPEDRYVSLGDAHAVVLGMGRVGASASRRLRDKHGMSVVGLELDSTKVSALRAEGLEVYQADAADGEFWERVAHTRGLQVAILAMPFHGTNAVALQQLRQSGFNGRVVAVAQYDDDARSLLADGADDVLQIYDGAGAEMADRAIEGG